MNSRSPNKASLDRESDLLRVSSSSEDDNQQGNTSEDSLNEQVVTFLTQMRNMSHLTGTEHIEQPVAGTSRDAQPVHANVAQQPQQSTAVQNMDRHVTNMVRDAEASKAWILDYQGNNFEQFNDRSQQLNSSQVPVAFEINTNQFMCTAMMDEDYLIVAAHVDESLECRVRNGEFIDFARLLLRDRVQIEQDKRVELVNQNGHLTCALVSDNNVGTISSFAQWEQAFRVFSNIYTRQYNQYNHVIHTASMNYSWNNIYAYDIDFRLHMACHPQRSWSVILQQAWNLRLQERHRNDSIDRKGKRGDICWRFNRGKCTYGDRCKFDHKCGICGRFGHGAHNCWKGGSDSWDSTKEFKDKRCDDHDDYGYGGNHGNHQQHHHHKNEVNAK